jgi:hypothetical protein
LDLSFRNVPNVEDVVVILFREWEDLAVLHERQHEVVKAAGDTTDEKVCEVGDGAETTDDLEAHGW